MGRKPKLFYMAILFLLLLFCMVLPLFLPWLQKKPVPAPAPTAVPSPAPTAPDKWPPYRAVWISYLEWQTVDFSTRAAYRADIRAMLGNIAALGANVVIAQVRPFGDALYSSSYYPYSHLCSGVQGRSPGFDPLEILLAEAHVRGLQVEAWCNPYRVQVNGTPTLCAENPAMLHPDWVKAVEDSLYLKPAAPAVQQFIAGSVTELCARYKVDGIHFDDYFYPTDDATFDAEDYAAYCAATVTPATLEAWRCENVSTLLRLCHTAAAAYGVRFGVAPQGNPDYTRTGQYSDAAAWLAAPGYIDYLMPQLYWGQHYTKNGDNSLALGNLAAQWAALPRCDAVALYFGLGAYRIGAGDGGDTAVSAAEWQSGHALADCAALLRPYGSGIGLYRYGSLYQNEAWPGPAAQECQSMHAFWG